MANFSNRGTSLSRMQKVFTLLVPAISFAFFVNGSSNRSDVPDSIGNSSNSAGFVRLPQPGRPVPRSPKKSPKSPNFLSAHLSQSCVDTLKELRAEAQLGNPVDTRDDCIKAFHRINFPRVHFDPSDYVLAPFLSVSQLVALFKHSPSKFIALPWNDISSLHYQVNPMARTAKDAFFSTIAVPMAQVGRLNKHGKITFCTRFIIIKMKIARAVALGIQAAMPEAEPPIDQGRGVQRRLNFNS